MHIHMLCAESPEKSVREKDSVTLFGVEIMSRFVVEVLLEQMATECMYDTGKNKTTERLMYVECYT